MDTDLRKMTFEALVGIVSRYPWFGAAQKILCERMSSRLGAEFGRPQFSDAAMHVPSRSLISDLLRPEASFADEDLTALLKKYVGGEAVENEEDKAEDAGVNSSFRGVGDYFSREQYESVKPGAGNWFRGLGSEEADAQPIEIVPEFHEDFCTETIAAIYIEQGYYDKAKDIYSKLILAYPEKSAYFAALIEKLGSKVSKK